MEKLLEGKTALVTGAASGMGKAIAQLFSYEGANVVFTDLNQDGLKTAVKECDPSRTHFIKVNVTSQEDFQQAVKEVEGKFGAIDVLVNCAGIPQSFTDIEELEEETWNRIIDVNLKSIFLSVKNIVPNMKKQKSGSIINIASIAGVRARPGLNAYCASKGAAIMLSKSLALELAPYNVRVNVINPGPAETPMIGKFLKGNSDEMDDAKKSVFIDSVPLGRLIQPDDIARAALYLASNHASIVTGTVLNVDGGRGI